MADLGRWALADKKLKPFRNKSGEFLNLTFSKVNDKVRAPVWEPSPQLLEDLVVGKVYDLEGSEEEWQGERQFKLHAYEVVPDEEINPEDFLPQTNFPTDLVWETLRTDIGWFPKHILKFLDSVQDNFRLAPASTYHHHAYLGGLLEHTWEVYQIILKIHDLFDVDPEVAMIGAVLHDIGKIWTYEYKTTLQMTEEGKQLGHIALGLRKLEELDLPLPILHIIASHHGKREWGALMEPETPEAWAVHYADLVSSRMNGVMPPS